MSVLPRVVLVVWAGLLLVIGGTLTAGHWVTLPTPSAADPALEAAVAAQRRPEEAGRWLALHVLYAECRCSQRIVETVLSTERPAGISERVLLIGEDPALAARIQAAGFGFEALTAEALSERYAITAAPLLVVADPSGEVRYSGGYSDRKQGPVTRDREIIASAMGSDGVLAALPLFGCAVSQSLQEALDPLGIKY